MSASLALARLSCRPLKLASPPHFLSPAISTILYTITEAAIHSKALGCIDPRYLRQKKTTETIVFIKQSIQQSVKIVRPHVARILSTTVLDRNLPTTTIINRNEPTIPKLYIKRPRSTVPT